MQSITFHFLSVQLITITQKTVIDYDWWLLHVCLACMALTTKNVSPHSERNKCHMLAIQKITMLVTGDNGDSFHDSFALEWASLSIEANRCRGHVHFTSTGDIPLLWKGTLILQGLQNNMQIYLLIMLWAAKRKY